MKSTLCITFNFLFSFFIYSQSQTFFVEKITINNPTNKEVFNICKNIESKFDPKLEYFWYNDTYKIKSTIGAAGGYLLHGKYQIFDKKGNLQHETNYYLGLKNGDEIIWEEKGEIKELIKYLNGKKTYWKYKDGSWTIEWLGTPNEAGSTKNTYLNNTKYESQEYFQDRVKHKYYEGGICIKLFYTSINDFKIKLGEYFEFWENGDKKVYGKFEDNYRVGNWYFYEIGGKISLKETYRINKTFTKNNYLLSIGGEYLDTKINKWIKCDKWVFYEIDSEIVKEIKYFVEGIEQ